MPLPNIFDATVSQAIINRINNLSMSTSPKWGVMQSAQMLAHCNVTYEMIYTDKHARPNFIVKFLLKHMVKKAVTNDEPYKPNGRTAKEFIITDAKMFDAEKTRLIEFIGKTQQLGAAHFDGKESHSFGNLSSDEWNNLFYKHLNHHLTQFGV